MYKNLVNVVIIIIATVAMIQCKPATDAYDPLVTVVVCGKAVMLKLTSATSLLREDARMLQETGSCIKVLSSYRTWTKGSHSHGRAIDVSNRKVARPYLIAAGFLDIAFGDPLHFEFKKVFTKRERQCSARNLKLSSYRIKLSASKVFARYYFGRLIKWLK